MAISQIPALTAHISFLLWELIIWQTRSWQIYPHPMVISQISVKFLFHSYSESLSFGRPSLGRSTPHQMAISQIPALLWKLIFGRPSVGRSPLWIKWQFHRLPALTAHISFLLWELHIWQTRSWQIYPPHQWQFYRFLLYSESSYLADQVLADLPPSSIAISQIPALPCRAHIWQTKCWQIYPHIKWQFHRFLWNSYFIPTLRAQHLADQVLADLPPIKYWFHRWLFMDLMLYLQITSHCTYRISPLNGNFTDSCSDSSHFMTAHISFLLWELNIWQTRSWQIYPHLNGNFTDSYSDNSYFILTLRANHLADQVLAYLPPHPMVILHILALTAH